MAQEMIERLADVRRSFKEALVIGALSPLLAEHLRAMGTRVSLLDPGTRIAAARGAAAGSEDALPFPAAHFDLIACCGTLDSVNDLPGALIALRKALVPDGLCLLSFTGAGTLETLRAVFREAESERPTQRIHPQVDVRALGDLLQRAGFAMPVADHHQIDVRYGTLFGLLGDLRGMGAAQCLSSPPPPLSRAILTRAADAFAARAEPDGKTRERFVILHGSGWAPSPDQPKPARRGSAKASLAQALKDRAG
jgi:SAM-dependent methyltransferase